ncbi:MAG: serine hydrolase domain-containing protein, partial [Gemmatimonadales bacterium]
WHLGSLTKAMTATLAGVLVERGTIEWTTRVSDVLPQLVEDIRPEYEHVTLRELLSHTAGLPTDVRRTPSWPRLRTDTMPIHEQRVRWSGELMRLAPESQRGRYHYSNAGYIIAGTMFEELTGESWETLIRREVFAPLGMRDVGFGPPGSRGKRSQPWGHVVGADGTREPFEPGPYADNPPALGPAGTVHATLESYAKFIAAHLAGARGHDGVVSARTFRTLHTPVDSAARYALGWGVAERGWGDGGVLNHHGTNTMWYATVWIAPHRDFAIIAATNLGGDGAFHGIDEVVATLIRRYEAWVARERRRP